MTADALITSSAARALPVASELLLEKKRGLHSTVRESLRAAQRAHARYRPWDTWLSILSIIAPTAAGTLGGVAVGTGHALGFASWSALCACVAGCSLVGAVSGALHKGLHLGNKVSEAQRCIASLRALDLTIVATDPAPEVIIECYRRITEDYHAHVI